MGNVFGSNTRICQRDIVTLHNRKTGCMKSSCITCSEGMEDSEKNALAISLFIDRDTCDHVALEGTNPLILDFLIMNNPRLSSIKVNEHCLGKLKAEADMEILRIIKTDIILDNVTNLLSANVLSAVGRLDEYCKDHDTRCTLRIDKTVYHYTLVWYLRTMEGKNIDIVFHKCIINDVQCLWELMSEWVKRPERELDTIRLEKFSYLGRSVDNGWLYRQKIAKMRRERDVSKSLQNTCYKIFDAISAPPDDTPSCECYQPIDH